MLVQRRLVGGPAIPSAARRPARGCAARRAGTIRYTTNSLLKSHGTDRLNSCAQFTDGHKNVALSDGGRVVTKQSVWGPALSKGAICGEAVMQSPGKYWAEFSKVGHVSHTTTPGSSLLRLLMSSSRTVACGQADDWIGNCVGVVRAGSSTIRRYIAEGDVRHQPPLPLNSFCHSLS